MDLFFTITVVVGYMTAPYKLRSKNHFFYTDTCLKRGAKERIWNCFFSRLVNECVKSQVFKDLKITEGQNGQWPEEPAV